MKTPLLLAFLLFQLSANEMYEIGKEIYKDTCISCHGEDGKADVDLKLIVKPRSLQSSILTEEQSYKIIKHGAHYWGASSDIMPAFGTVYDETKLRAISFYIKKEFHPNAQVKIDKLYNESDPIPKEKISKKTTKI